MTDSPARVLVLDDDRELSALVAAALGDRWVVERRADPEEGYALLAVEEFDVVLTDVRMRGLDGLELCSRVAASHPDLPVVVMTAFGSLETAVAAIRAGAYDFLTKPFDVEVQLEDDARFHALWDTASERAGRRLTKAEFFRGLLDIGARAEPEEQVSAPTWVRSDVAGHVSAPR